ncbi:MAG: sigma-54-dependent Fis family transcriptional regulator [Deltaproteobacteria bacterium]|jgi:two-component system response regulator AtoC|nr:sigma-54-dependent Fis family transcriptional regulator [Deltaproteobacteria bacterium]
MSQLGLKNIQYKSEQMEQINKLIHSLIPVESNLNIFGPSGSGKSAWMNYLIEKSNISGQVLRLDIKEMDEGLFKEVLEKNSFRYILLENIEYLHKENQTCLAQYIQKSGLISKPVILSTSTRNLTEIAKEGLLRQDLYYKLTVFKIELPSLKEISEDIPVLANWYAQLFAPNYKKGPLSLTPEALQKLSMYFWPGNISELESVMERAVILSQENVISEKHIRFDDFQKHSSLNLSMGMSLSEVEKRLILQTLEHTENNRTKAAHILGISIRTLRNKINEYKEAGIL